MKQNILEKNIGIWKNWFGKTSVSMDQEMISEGDLHIPEPSREGKMNRKRTLPIGGPACAEHALHRCPKPRYQLLGQGCEPIASLAEGSGFSSFSGLYGEFARVGWYRPSDGTGETYL